jgi:hypothetical protein
VQPNPSARQGTQHPPTSEGSTQAQEEDELVQPWLRLAIHANANSDDDTRSFVARRSNAGAAVNWEKYFSDSKCEKKEMTNKKDTRAPMSRISTYQRVERQNVRSRQRTDAQCHTCVLNSVQSHCMLLLLAIVGHTINDGGKAGQLLSHTNNNNNNNNNINIKVRTSRGK